MIWPNERTVGIPRTFSNCIRLLGMIGPNLTAQQLQDAFPTIFNHSEFVSYMPASSTMTPCNFVSDIAEDELLVMQGGLQGLDQVPALVLGFTGRTDGSGALPQPWAGAAAQVFGNRPIYRGLTWRTITLIGHSYGGAVMTQLAIMMKAQYPDAVIRLYTFGAPQSIYGNQWRLWENIIVRRCFHDLDPIPNCPTPLEDGSCVLQFISNTQARTWTRFTQPGLGFVLRPNTYPVLQQNPTLINPARFLGGLASWMSGTTMFGNPEHSLAEYSTTIASLVDGGTVPVDTPIAAVRVPASTPTPGQLNTSRELSIAVSNGVVESAPTAAANRVAQTVTPVVRGKWSGKRVKGHRYIYYDTQQVMPVRTRRLQISLVRYLNKHNVGV